MTVTAAHSDAAVAQRRAADPAASAWVAASAGTGKTRVLTDRVLNLLLAGTPPERILCLTFTKAAAAEMANRLNERLGEWASLDDRDLGKELTDLTGRTPHPDQRRRARRLFAQVLDTPGGLKIQTIHAFCQATLRRFPLEAGIAPHFQVMDERTANEMLRAAQEEMLGHARRGDDETLATALAGVTAHLRESVFAELMAELARERGRLRGLMEAHDGVDGLIAATRSRLGVARFSPAASRIKHAAASSPNGSPTRTVAPPRSTRMPTRFSPVIGRGRSDALG
jgi:ATP-dependent helicase/nuclease subunit A